MSGRQSFTRDAPAKLNLHLRVGPVRGDGFHPIRSLFVPLGLADTVRLTLGGDGRACRCDDPSVPGGEANLSYRAAVAAGAEGFEIDIEKRIPAGGGLGGGSSDAAAVLMMLADTGRVGRDALPELAAGLGSDVPFFLHGGPAWCEGRGEVVTPAPPVRPSHAVLILPVTPVPTGPVFSEYDREPMPIPHEDAGDWHGLPAAELLPRLANDLEAPAFRLHPELGELRRRAEAAAGRPVRMTGSGSTLFTLADDADDAAAIAAKLPGRTLITDLKK